MASEHLPKRDELPPLEKELTNEWNSIVSTDSVGEHGAESLRRLVAIYERCYHGSAWRVSVDTVSMIAGSLLDRAGWLHDFKLGIRSWEQLLTHPDLGSIDTVTRIDRNNYFAVALWRVGEKDRAVEIWMELARDPDAMPAVQRNILFGILSEQATQDPEAVIDTRLRPLLGLLKYRSKRLREIASSGSRATCLEVAKVLEAIRAREWAKRRAKLGKPFRHAS